MANSVVAQTLLDGDRNVVVKIVGVLDTSDLAATTYIDVSALVPACTGVRIDKIDYSISSQLAVYVLWDATTDDNALVLAGSQRMKAKEFGGLTNPNSAGVTGDVQVKTTGWTSGIQTFTLILQCVKMGV